MKKLFFLGLFLGGILCFGKAQDKQLLDSLMSVYQTSRYDTTRILALAEIAYEYRLNKPDTAIILAEKALSLNQKSNFLKTKGKAFLAIGMGNFIKGNYPLASEYFLKSLNIFEQIHLKPEIANTLNSIGDIYYNQADYPLALEYYQKSLNINEEIGNKQGAARSLNDIGNIYDKQGNYSLALEYYQKSIHLKESLNDKRGLTISLNDKGNVYHKQGNYPLALEYFQKSLSIKEELDDQRGIAINLNNIGNIYYRQGNYPLAATYYHKSLKIKEETGDKRGIAVSLGNIGNIYYRQDNYPLALEYYQKSLKIKEETGDKRGIATSLNDIGSTYHKQGNYSLALECYQKSLKIREEIGDKQGLTYPLNGIAKNYQAQKDYDQSIQYALKGLEIARGIGALAEENILSQTLYESYKLKGDYVKALEYHELFKKNNDSVFNADNAKKIASIEAQAEILRKEKEIELLNKNQEILKKDYQLQRIEAERQKNAKLALEKQAEADSLFSLARAEKDQRKADSLHSLAQKKQLEVEKHLVEQQRLKAESKARATEILKEKEAKEFQRDINYLILAGLFSVVVLLYFIYRSRQKERKAKEEIAQQNEEIQQINEELHTTLQIVEQERQKSDKLLLNILPEETAAELKEKGTATPQHYDLVTVLFTDFKNFSKISEKLKPQEIIENLNTCFSALDEICERHNLEKIKTIGDAYMCAGGIPVANQSNPIDAVRAALEMQAWMTHWKAKQQAKGEEAWEIRLGIHSGPVVAGVIGKNKFAYDIWGDTVNLASRMESSGEVGKVNISGTTYELVKDQFQCTYRGKIEAKNKGEVAMYFVEKVL